MQELLFECNLLELTAIREWNALWEYVPANWGLRPLPVSPFSPEGKACQWWRNLGRDGGGRFLVMFQKLGCFYCFRLCVFTTPKFYLCSLCKSERLSCIKKNHDDQNDIYWKCLYRTILYHTISESNGGCTHPAFGELCPLLKISISLWAFWHGSDKHLCHTDKHKYTLQPTAKWGSKLGTRCVWPWHLNGHG